MISFYFLSNTFHSLSLHCIPIARINNPHAAPIALLYNCATELYIIYIITIIKIRIRIRITYELNPSKGVGQTEITAMKQADTRSGLSPTYSENATAIEHAIPDLIAMKYGSARVSGSINLDH